MKPAILLIGLSILTGGYVSYQIITENNLKLEQEKKDANLKKQAEETVNDLERVRRQGELKDCLDRNNKAFFGVGSSKNLNQAGLNALLEIKKDQDSQCYALYSN